MTGVGMENPERGGHLPRFPEKEGGWGGFGQVDISAKT